MRSPGCQDKKVRRSLGAKSCPQGILRYVMINLISRDLIKILSKELFNDFKSALILKGVLSPMNSTFKLNFRYNIEMTEADFGTPLKKSLTWAVSF